MEQKATEAAAPKAPPVVVASGNATVVGEVQEQPAGDTAVVASIIAAGDKAAAGTVTGDPPDSGNEEPPVSKKKAGVSALMDDDDTFGEIATPADEPDESTALGSNAGDGDLNLETELGAGLDEPTTDDLLLGDGPQDDALLAVHRVECVQCSHLVAFATKTWNKCHFSNGNDLCPAQSARITLNLNLGPTVKRFLQCEADRDAIGLAKFYKHLGEQDEWVQKEVLEAIEAGRKKAQRQVQQKV